MTVDQRDPEAVVRAVATALHQERWRGAAALCNPAAIAEWHSKAIEGIRERGPVAEQLLGWIGAESLAELEESDALPAFARSLQRQAPENEIAAAKPRFDASRRSFFDEHVARLPLVTVFGHVREGDRLAHVVARDVPTGHREPLSDDVDDPGREGCLHTVTLECDDDGRWWMPTDATLFYLYRTQYYTPAELGLASDEAEDWEGEPPDD